jgi:hypothetical protein
MLYSGKANANLADTIAKPTWIKQTGWNWAVGYTRNNYNSFSVDIGRYKTYRKSFPSPMCAFSSPPFVIRGISFDYIYKGTSQAYAIRAYAQLNILSTIGMRLDVVNVFENGKYSPKIRPSIGISAGDMLDIHLNYTIGMYNTDVMKQGLGVSVRLNLNKFLLDRRGPSPNYNW